MTPADSTPADSTPADGTPADSAARGRIRDDHAQTLFVEAGAGTGKTTALVSRVVELLATGRLAAPGALAAITFTENAAAELRNRIREGLEGAARGEHLGRVYSTVEADRCAAALDLLEDAAISTLHGFAARILADFPVEAGLAPGFAVRDAVTARIGAGASWQAFLDELLGDETVQPHLLAALTLDVQLGKLRQVASAFAGNWDLLTSRPFTEVPLPSAGAAGVLGPLREAVAHRGPDGDKLTRWLRITGAPFVAELESLIDPLDVLDALNRTELRCKYGVKAAWQAAGSSKDEVVALLSTAESARTELLARIGAAVAQTLCARIQDHVLADVDRRRTDGALDFHDLLVLARELLRGDTGVRRALHERYQALLVDEFQDTDPLQAEIACLIAGGSAGGTWDELAAAVPGGRLFFVGDPKQSIYRFRRADVQLYLRAGQTFTAGRTALSVNFRSDPAVTTAVNAVFGELLAGGPVPFAELAPHRAPAGTAGVQLLGGPVDLDAAACRDAEALHIARAITTGWPLGSRRAAYRDVAILLPTRAALPSLEKALGDHAIPYRIESRSLVWSTDAVRDLITLLQAIDNPADEVATVAALRHPGLACSEAHLAAWRSSGGYWNYLAPLADVPGPVADGMATLRRYHDLHWWLPVNELVERIVRELRLTELTAAFPRPRDHWRRLRFVTDAARAFCDAGGSGLTAFTAWAADQIDSDADVLETAVPEPDDDAVRILTVHGSKGLEFPVTIVADLGGTGRPVPEVLWAGQRPEVRLRGAVATAGFTGQAAAEKQLDEDEALRLLYVAMTRARDHLVLGCYHRTKGQTSHARRLWPILTRQPGLATVEPPIELKAAIPVRPAPRTAGEPSDGRDAFLARHAALLAAAQGQVAASATSLVSVPLNATRGGGARLGSAVHQVLELADLVTGEDIAALAEAAAAEHEIPWLAADVAARARSAISAPIVRQAVTGGRYWREVYVVVPDHGRFLEGYIDLLVETPTGELVVVDYKTDRAASDAEAAAKAVHYTPQLTAYAQAIETATLRTVSRAVLVFAAPGTAREWEVPLPANLRQRLADVEE
ncbi:MAG: UvrD/REP helicase [Actinomycetia bacterium]|nr:UvrD/REP helicase [Actinomycetes bacterium]